MESYPTMRCRPVNAPASRGFSLFNRDIQCMVLLLLTCTAVCAAPRKRGRQTEKPPADSVSVADTVEAAPPRPSASTIPLAQWPGQRFMVLPMSQTFRAFGYELFPTELLGRQTGPIDPQLQLKNRRFRYEALAGHELLVHDVRESNGEYLIAFENRTAGHAVYAHSRQRAVKAIAPLDDLETARARWNGTVIYARKRQVNTYDSASGRMGSIKVSITTPLNVVDVMPGSMPLPPQPLWIMIEGPEGLSGFIPTCISWTNVLSDMVRQDEPWSEFVLERNPREQYEWPAEVWSNIDEHRLVTGMTLAQARLCWDEPLAADTSVAGDTKKIRWTYQGQVLLFRDGVLMETRSK